MGRKTKLLLIPCSGYETATLTHDIFKILREDYSLNDQVELLDSSVKSEIPDGTRKDHKHGLVTDFFPGKEAQADIGRNELKDVIRGKHVALVQHLFTPNRNVSVNDHIFAVRGMLDLVSKTETEKRTLVAPYFTYVRSHSIEKYEAQGFYQFDSLKMTLEDYKRSGLDAIITIDPHSSKAEQIAKIMQLEFYSINPFHSGRQLYPAKLGLKGKANKITKKLRPFQELFAKLKKDESNKLYCVALDDGTERRSENFIERAHPELEPSDVYDRLAYLEKVRTSYDNSTIRFKPFSAIQEGNIDKEGTYIGIDDMWASGGTGDGVAKMFKDGGAKRFELWISHAVTTKEQVENANGRNNIDLVRCLDTVPIAEGLNVEVIKASANFLAAELYKSHQRLISSA